MGMQTPGPMDIGTQIARQRDTGTHADTKGHSDLDRDTDPDTRIEHTEVCTETHPHTEAQTQLDTWLLRHTYMDTDGQMDSNLDKTH